MAKTQEISINFNCYTIRFRKKGNTEVYYTYKEVFGKLSFRQMIQEFIKTIDTKCYMNESKDRMLTLLRGIDFSDKIFSGVVKKGHSSHEIYIDEIKNNQANTVSTITSDKFQSSPFYFLISLPKSDSKYMVFMAQSYMQFGFKQVFEDAFQKYFKKNFQDEYLCEFGTLSIGSLFKKFVQEGKIKKLRLKKYGLTQEVEDVVQDEDYSPKDYEMELSVKIKAKNKKFLDFIRDIDLEETSFLELFKIDNYDYDEALVDISAGNRKRVLNFTDPESFSASFDVTKEAKIDARTKHPDFSSLDKEAKNILSNEIIPNIKS